MCWMLDVTRQGYYAWTKRGPSRRDRDDSALKTKMRALFEFHKKRYGVRGIYAELCRGGVRVGCVLTSCDGLAGESPAGVAAKRSCSWWPAGGET